MTKRLSGAAGTPEQKKIDLTFVQPDKTTRSEVAQKLAWADSGIKDDHLFLARWASSGSGWVWFVGGVGARGEMGGGGGSFRNWKVHNLLVEFDDAGLVKDARDVPTPDLLPSLQKWLARSNSPAPELSSTIELNVFLRHIDSPIPSAKLVLSADSFGFLDNRKPKHSFHIHPSMIKSISSGIDDKEGRAPDSSFIGATILFKEETPAGKKVSINLSAPDLLVLLKYLHLANSSPYAP